MTDISPDPARNSAGQRPNPPQQIGNGLSVAGRLRNYFLAGVLVTAPLAITIWLTWEFIGFVDSRVVPLLPARWNPDSYLPFSVPGLGVFLVFLFLTLVGMLAAGIVGRMIMRQGERVMRRVPVLRSVYGATKQVFHAVLAHRSQAFRQVALIEFPNRGCWAIGFVTGVTKGEVQRRTRDEVVSVFLPATPNPTTGFLLFLPQEDVHLLDMTVEEGLKLVISGGIVVPPTGRKPLAEELADELVPAERPRLSFAARIRNYFLAGVLVTAPAAITIWLAWQFVSFVDSRVTPLLPEMWRPEHYLPFGVPGLGVLMVVVGLTLIGMLAAGYIGRAVMRASDWFLNRLPVIRSIYSALKQILETVMASRSEAFRECVLFPFPRENSWAIGFVTGRTEGHVQDLTEEYVVNVFLPTTPNPTSGYLVFVPQHRLIHLDMSIEEGLKMVVSGGIVVPRDPKQQGEGAHADDLHDIGQAVLRLTEER